MDAETYLRKRDVSCLLCEREKAMALKKKPIVVDDAPKPDDVAKLKQEAANSAKAVNDALDKQLKAINRFGKSPLEEEWSNVRNATNQLNNEFGDVEVRVMQVGPDGRLTDVSDRVSPRDIRPEQIEGFQSSDGSVKLPRRPSGEIDHEAALDLLGQLVGRTRFPNRRPIEETASTAAMKEMEDLLTESDKILKKLRR